MEEAGTLDGGGNALGPGLLFQMLAKYPIDADSLVFFSSDSRAVGGRMRAADAAGRQRHGRPSPTCLRKMEGQDDPLGVGRGPGRRATEMVRRAPCREVAMERKAVTEKSSLLVLLFAILPHHVLRRRWTLRAARIGPLP